MMPMATTKSRAPPSASATIEPPTPAPNAMPSVNMSASAADMKPSSPGVAASSTSSVIIEYASPMPRPATPQPMAATATGELGSSTALVTMMPTTISAVPAMTTARRRPIAAARAWSHDPMAHVTAAADSATPPRVTLPLRTSTTVRGTKASVPKKANPIRKIAAIAAGIPVRARSVPGGTRWTRERSANQAPTIPTPSAAGSDPSPKAASTPAEPTDSWTASNARRESLRPGEAFAAGTAVAGPIAANGRHSATAVSSTGGATPRKTQRQPTASVTIPASAGPTRPGTTQALEVSAIMRGRARGAYARAITAYTTALIAPDPDPWMARPTITICIDGARPAMTIPAANSSAPRTNGRAGP